MLSIESDRFPQILLFLLTATTSHHSPSQLLNAKKGLKTVSHQSLNESVIVWARDVFKIPYPKLLIGPIYTSKRFGDLMGTSRTWLWIEFGREATFGPFTLSETETDPLWLKITPKPGKGNVKSTQLLMEIGSLHNMLVINNELWAHWHVSATAEGALYKRERCKWWAGTRPELLILSGY